MVHFRGPICHFFRADSWAPDNRARGSTVRDPVVQGPTVWGPTVWGPICLEPGLERDEEEEEEKEKEREEEEEKEEKEEGEEEGWDAPSSSRSTGLWRRLPSISLLAASQRDHHQHLLTMLDKNTNSAKFSQLRGAKNMPFHLVTSRFTTRSPSTPFCQQLVQPKIILNCRYLQR